jgi:hypothetical protein
MTPLPIVVMSVSRRAAGPRPHGRASSNPRTRSCQQMLTVSTPLAEGWLSPCGAAPHKPLALSQNLWTSDLDRNWAMVGGSKRFTYGGGTSG